MRGNPSRVTGFRMLLVLAAFFFGVAPFPATASTAFPPWLVPVLQVVSETDVIPGTGVALGPGRVLVPAEFAALEVPLVVLDGGGDLARHGRPATVLERWSLAGLAVLDVPGLDRPAPVLDAGPLIDGQTVALWAVAPAELLRQGEATLTRRATVAVDGTGQVTLGTDQHLPNLTGALVDACGHWVGHSAARGVASLATAANTLYQWLPLLADRLDQGGIELARARCERPFPSLVVSVPVEDAAVSPIDDPAPVSVDAVRPPVDDTAPPEPAAPSASPVLDEPELLPAPDLPPPEKRVQEGEGAASDPISDQAVGTETDTVVPKDGGFPAWAWGLILVGLALTSLAILRSTRGRAVASVPVMETVAWLRSEEGTWPIEAAGGVVDRVLGRHDADLLVTGETISRHHARFRGTPGSLQLVDLDSTNGTFVNGQPCAPRTGVAVSPGDRLRFGDRDFELLAVDEVTS